ncbi:hypothetical protein QTQ03_09995 [Micromonospora sp. WMMA1363]|uniref:hypothetical protein n=1 Tax=Micromonospora sp. WMMA1363 TaxID=3053985 RepID=UPI00259D0D07|nr:hypothetical protein [Micromonospora sp. WMMA1363]MDM4719894.1 hypothetical protein [Micromonospora sp. WMMA1363]
MEFPTRPRRTPPERSRRPETNGRGPRAVEPDPAAPEPPPPGAGRAPTPAAAPAADACPLRAPGKPPPPPPPPPPAPHRPLPDGTHTGALPRVVTGRLRTTLVLLAAVATVSATALVVGLSSRAPEPPRALTSEERTRLAAVRVTNYRDLRAGVHLTAGIDAERIELIGWVDWSRPLLYLDVGGPGAGTNRGLLQATPTVVVLRPDPAAAPIPAAPPLVPPADRWRLATLPADGRLAPVLDLLSELTADRPDPLVGDRARWTGRTEVTAEPVDVLEAPLPPLRPDADALTVADGLPRWWVDRDARVHRLELRLPGVGPVTVRFNRTDRPTLRPVDALGGRPGTARSLTAVEQLRLARLPTRLRAVAGASATLTAPLAPGTNLRGLGWLSWRQRAAYLAVTDSDAPGRRTLLRHDDGRTHRMDVPASTVAGTVGAPARPPLPAPARGWQASPADELTTLVDAAVRAAAVGPTGTARRIRGDSLAGTAVDVLELRASGPPRRYWIDKSGLLHRLELRSRAGTWAQLDLTPGSVPRLGSAPEGR